MCENATSERTSRRYDRRVYIFSRRFRVRILNDARVEKVKMIREDPPKNVGRERSQATFEKRPARMLPLADSPPLFPPLSSPFLRGSNISFFSLSLPSSVDDPRRVTAPLSLFFDVSRRSSASSSSVPSPPPPPLIRDESRGT